MAEEIRMCVVCGLSVPASHDRSKAWPECPASDACTFDMTPSEAAEHWRDAARRANDQCRELCTKLATAESDIVKLRKQVGKLLTMLDDLYCANAEENGGLTMHTQGQTPDWFVEAAMFAAYGYSGDDPRAAVQEPL